ncbi:cobaltochelatase subunit CobN [Gimesia chilikensis]|uniref:cobaltochelatase subunit CobN n=1 Tax=Gimesia chilikensis TaxID=2605989 RepID=UPI003A91E2EA
MFKKYLTSVVLLALCFSGGLWAYYEYLRPFRIATIGFSDTDWANWENALQQTPYALHRYPDAGIDTASLQNYNLVFIRGQGLNLTPEQVARIARARAAGTHFYIRTTTNALSSQQNSLPETHRQQIADYLKHGGEENLIGMAHYAAHHLGGREVEVPALIEVPQYGFFHLDGKIFESLADYEAFAATQTSTRDTEPPRVALLAGFMDPQDKMNREPVDVIIRKLEAGGAKVYPIFGRTEAFSLLQAVQPDLILTFPHGRFSYGGQGDQLLRELNCPIVSALPLLSNRERWLNDERGMEGGFMGQSITAPELDGIIEPIVVSSMEPNARGLNVRAPMDDQIENRVNLLLNWLKLRKKPNSEKRIVIVYYKSPGMAALSAGGLEVAPALWNTLQRLQSEGYDLGGPLPESPDALFALIQAKGKTLGQWALGAFENFLKEADPELVPATRYAEWFQKALSPKRQQETINLWGELPGEKMVTSVAGQPHLVISRIQLGNVVIMPQPTVGGGGETEDEISSIHGTDQAAPHFYLGAYLWARYGFQADAIMHFGTHGSLEFTYGKSNCLSRDCWPHILIGDVPHIYPYVINNVGEALVAKRRSNAVIVSHLTPPFMEAGLYGDLSLLHDKIHDWEQVEDPLLREETLRSVTELVNELNLAEDLGLSGEELTNRLLTEAELTEVHNYIHQLKDQSITDGLHVIGRNLGEKQIEQTATAMLGEQGVDQLLSALGKPVNQDSMEYRQDLARQFVSEVLTGKLKTDLLFSADEQAIIKAAVAAEKQRTSPASGQKPDGLSGATQKGKAKHNQQTPRGKSSSPSHPSHPQQKQGTQPAGAEPVDSKEPSLNNSPADDHSSRSFSAAQLIFVSADAQPTDDQQLAPRVKLTTDSPVVARKPQEEPEIKRLWNSADEFKAMIVKSPLQQQKLIELIEVSRLNARNLQISPERELEQIIAALNASFIAPSSGGDPLVNSDAIPTGRNLYSINAEQTPTLEAWRVGVRLTDEMLAAHRASHAGNYPRQVAISLWGGEFIRGKGTAIAQILYLIGMRPVWNSRGVVYDVEVIPSDELQRPRIDVLVQTSGQFRDAAASRIKLIDDAVQIASNLEQEIFPNFVREGTEQTEQALKKGGVSAKDARDFATARIFGSASNSSYGTQIMGMVERGDTWESESQVAKRYIQNMSGVYRDGDRWGTVLPGLLEAQMQGVEAVVHPRSSNTWGPLSLDHVYEFMGGITLAVRDTTGTDPTGYFSDLRQPGRAKVTTSIGAIREEARTALWNPRFIQSMQREGPSAAASLTENVRNMYGWNVMQPAAISQDMWDETFQVYIEDKHNLKLREYFEEKNPYALQDMTAVMLETARKGYWTPNKETLQKLAAVHTELVAEHGAACSYETCGNQAFHDFLNQQLNAPGNETSPATLSDYQLALSAALQPTQSLPEVEGIEMSEVQQESTEADVIPEQSPALMILVCFGVICFVLGSSILRREKRQIS